MIAERNILLGPNKLPRDALIQQIRTKALVQARNNMQPVKQMERQAFGKKSYWYCKGRGEHWVPDDDEDPDSDTEAASKAAAEGTGGK